MGNEMILHASMTMLLLDVRSHRVFLLDYVSHVHLAGFSISMYMYRESDQELYELRIYRHPTRRLTELELGTTPCTG